MARANAIKILRTTRANLAAQTSANGLLAGELYLVTDESRVAVGTAVNGSADMAKLSEVVTASGDFNVGNRIPRSDGTGKALKPTAILIDDDWNLYNARTVSYNGMDFLSSGDFDDYTVNIRRAGTQMANSPTGVLGDYWIWDRATVDADGGWEDAVRVTDTSGRRFFRSRIGGSWGGWLEFVWTAMAQTLTNKRITPRVTSQSGSVATPTINTDNCDVHRLTGLTANITSMTTNLSGTPNHGDELYIEFTGTASPTISWGAGFESSTVSLPTTTSGTNMLTVHLRYNSATSKWRCCRTW